ncbi:MAG: hypothetical protein ACRBN8_45100 [Nannocystales bacterium]
MRTESPTIPKDPREVHANGEAAGVRRSILEVLRARRLWITPYIEDRVAFCERLKTLDNWLARAPTAVRAEDIFNPTSYTSKTTLEQMLQERLVEQRLADEYTGHLQAYTWSIAAALVSRGLSVSEEVRDRIGRCKSLSRLERWLRRSVTVARTEDVFVQRPEPAASSPATPPQT